MRRKVALGTMGLLAVLATAIVTWGQDAPSRVTRWERPQRFQDHGPGGGFGHPGMGWRHVGHGLAGERLLRLADSPRMRAYLNLTDQQVSRLHQLTVDAEKTSVQTRASLQLRGIEMRELLRADNPDQDAILKKVDEVSALRGQMARQRIEAQLAARKVLAPEQQQKLRALGEQRELGGFGPQHRMEHRRGQAGPGGPARAPAAAPASPEASQAH